MTGVSKGIKYLSQGSAGLAIALFVFILVVGPAAFIANLYGLDGLSAREAKIIAAARAGGGVAAIKAAMTG